MLCFGIMNAIKTKLLGVDVMIIRNIESQKTNLKGKSFYVTNGGLLADLNLLDEVNSAFQKREIELRKFFEKRKLPTEIINCMSGWIQMFKIFHLC